MHMMHMRYMHTVDKRGKVHRTAMFVEALDLLRAFNVNTFTFLEISIEQ